jgi:hypothetical protein
LRQWGDPLPAPGDEVVEVAVHIALGQHLLDVGARRKGLFGPGQDDRADRVIRFQRIDRVRELFDQRGAQRVQRLRPVEGDEADRTAPFDKDVFIGHRLRIPPDVCCGYVSRRAVSGGRASAPA